jgi:hypothetical protein
MASMGGVIFKSNRVNLVFLEEESRISAPIYSKGCFSRVLISGMRLLGTTIYWGWLRVPKSEGSVPIRKLTRSLAFFQ